MSTDYSSRSMIYVIIDSLGRWRDGRDEEEGGNGALMIKSPFTHQGPGLYK